MVSSVLVLFIITDSSARDGCCIENTAKSLKGDLSVAEIYSNHECTADSTEAGLGVFGLIRGLMIQGRVEMWRISCGNLGHVSLQAHRRSPKSRRVWCDAPQISRFYVGFVVALDRGLWSVDGSGAEIPCSIEIGGEAGLLQRSRAKLIGSSEPLANGAYVNDRRGRQQRHNPPPPGATRSFSSPTH
jgi:hypothetical protein